MTLSNLSLSHWLDLTLLLQRPVFVLVQQVLGKLVELIAIWWRTPLLRLELVSSFLGNAVLISVGYLPLYIFRLLLLHFNIH